jgi:phenylalanyl-tRNA synthetase beta chain
MAKQFNGGSKSLNLVNPISSELTDMRPSILPTLLQAAQKNIKKGFEDISFFEVGPIFTGDNPDEQINTITGIRLGYKNKKDWKNEPVNFDFYDIKLDVLKTLEAVGLPKNSLKVFKDTPTYYHPGRSAVFKIGQTVIANFGEIHPEINNFFGFKKPVIGFEIFHENIPLPKRNKTSRSMLKLTTLQPVTREFAFIIDEVMDSDKLIQVAKSINKDLIKDVLIYDVYKGNKIPIDKKSIAIKVFIQPIHETLTDTDLEKISSDLIAVVNKKLSGTLRDE